MENIKIAEMSRDELVRLVAEKSDTLGLDALKQVLDRIDMLDGKEKTAAESAMAASLPAGSWLTATVKCSFTDASSR